MDKLVDGNYVDSDGDLIWVTDSSFHRADGPAILFGKGLEVRGSLYPPDDNDNVYFQMSWWWHGEALHFADWLEANTELSAEEIVMLKLEYG